MLTKVYILLWGLLFFAAAVIFLTGNMTELMLVVFGFISFGMVFMGMMGVLPVLVTHPAPVKSEKRPKAPRKPLVETAAARIGYATAGLFDAKGVHLRKPKYP